MNKKIECLVCHKPFQIGDDAWGTTLGQITEDGFQINIDEPWEEIICNTCYNHRLMLLGGRE